MIKKLNNGNTLLLFIIIILGSVILISCGDKEQEASEIIYYYNEEWISINNFKRDNLDSVVTEFIQLDIDNDKSGAVELLEKEIIPITEEVISQLEEVKPVNKEIEKMNELQIDAEQFALESFYNTIKYYDGELTESELAKDKDKLDSMYKDVIDYHKKVFKKYDLKKSNEKKGDFTKLVKEE